MKKVFAILTTLLIASSAFALDAVVLKTSGKVEIQKGNAWVALKEGDTLGKGSVISTGFKSEASLKIRDSVINVAALTRMTIEQLVEKPGKDEARVYLSTGTLKANIKHTEDRRTGFTARSPVATASVRGTDFVLSTGFNTANLSTNDGAVAFYPTVDAAEPILSTEEEDSSAPVMPGTGNSAAQVAPQAPKGAFTVTKGQGAALKGNGQAKSAVETAQSMVSIAPPQTAASKEAAAIAPVSAPQAIQVTTVDTTPSGTLTVTIDWE